MSAAEKRITRLYAWVATHADGTEGIIAGEVGGLWCQLVAGSKRVADMMADGAHEAVERSKGCQEEAVSCRLVMFRRIETTEDDHAERPAD